MGLLDRSTIASILQRGGNPELYPNAVDTFEAKRELDSALSSAIDIETNVTNFTNYFGSRVTPSGQLNDFIANAEYTMTNKFKVYIYGPDLTQFGFKSNIWQDFTICAETVQFPGKSFDSVPYRLNAMPIIPLPISLNYENTVSINFRVHRNYAQRDAFLKWQELIYPSTNIKNPNKITNSVILEANSGFNYYDAYAKDFSIVVTSLNTQGQTLMVTKFYGVYPITVHGMTVDWGTADYVKQNITFAFYKMHTITGDEA